MKNECPEFLPLMTTKKSLKTWNGCASNLRKPKGKLKICILLFLITLVILSHAWLLESWLTVFKCSYRAAAPHKEWNATVRAVPRWQVCDNQENIKRFVFASVFVSCWQTRGAWHLLYGSREKWWRARQGEEGFLPYSKIGESWSWGKRINWI